MIVCICKAVTDRDISNAISGGAATLEEVAARTRAGTCCGSCRSFIESMIGQAATGLGPTTPSTWSPYIQLGRRAA